MAKPKKVATPQQVERDVLYPEVKIWKYLADKAMNAKEARRLLGWMTEDEYITRYHEGKEMEKEEREGILNLVGSRIKDYLNNQVVCTNNVGNRPYNDHWAWELAYTILNKRWRFNGEAMQIGKTGRTISAQHRLIGLNIAHQMWEHSEHWKENWPTEPTIETLVVVGIEEDPETTRTVDNARKRTLADVIYADTQVFASLSPVERKTAAKVMQSAVKFMWQRTGAKDNPFAPYSSHAECLDFLARHDTLKSAVMSILSKNRGKEKPISSFITPGCAASILYLMGASQSDPEKYKKQSPPTERVLKWGRWDEAEKFWSAFSKDTQFNELRVALTRTDGSLLQKTCVLAKAWACYLEEKRPTEVRVKLKVETDDNGIDRLMEFPDFGGIDLGPPREKEKPEEEESVGSDAPDEEEVEVEEIEEEATPVKRASAGKNGAVTGKKKRVKKEEAAEEEVTEEEKEPSEEELEEVGEDGVEEIHDDADEIPLRA